MPLGAIIMPKHKLQARTAPIIAESCRRRFFHVSQIDGAKIDQTCAGAKGVLKENVMLIPVIRHEIDQDVGNQEDVPFIVPCHKGQPQKGYKGQGNKRKFLWIPTFKHCLHRI